MPYPAKQYNLNLLSEENVKEYVLPEYNLENASINRVKFKDTDKQRAVYKVDLGPKCFCLKKVYFSKEDLLFIYSAMEWLFRHGINTPRILPTKNRGRFASYKDMLFILTPWIDGVKCNYDTDEHVLSSMLTLGKMHIYGKNFIPINGSTIRKSFDNLPNSLNKHFLQLINCFNLASKYNDKFSKLFLDNFHINYTLAQISSQISSTIEMKNLSTSLCHLDYVNKNIIFDKCNNVWIIDFDKCKLDYCAHDISYFLRRYLKRDTTCWNVENAIQSLQSYEKIHPLNLEDYKYILSYLAFPQKFWKISRDYYNNIKKCNHSSFVYLFKKSIGSEEQHLNFVVKLGKYTETKFNTKLT